MGFHRGGWFSYLRANEEKPKVTRVLLMRVLSYAAPYRWAIIGMLVMILLTTGLNLLTPLILRNLIDVTIPNGDLTRLAWLVLALLLIPAINGLVGIFQRRLNAMVGEGVIYDLRVDLFARLQHMSLRFFTNTRVGELMSRLNNDVVGAQNAVSNTIVSIITNLIQAMALLIVMLAIEWRLTLIALLLLPFFVLVARRIGNRLREISRLQMDLNAQMNAHMNETLNVSGALLVKLFGRENIETERFRQRASNVRDMGIQRALMGASFFVFLGLLGAIGTALVYGVGGYLVIAGAFTIGTIVAFGSYLNSLYGALQGLSNAPVEFATSVVSFERVFEVLDLPQDIPEKEHPLVLGDVRGELTFEQVTFAYDLDEKKLLSDVKRHGQMHNVTAVLSGDGGNGGSSHPGRRPTRDADSIPGDEPIGISQAREMALREIDFRAQPGQLVALVGPSGAGKTTLTYLIPRLYDPSAGCIRLDGHDLRDLSLQSLVTQIGMVTQETYLFHDTIRTNLLYARLDATDQDLEEACRIANIHTFIMELPDGYDTIVGERGYRLSGGEKQRLALARVILKNPRILVLDEATSHLDSESEALIQDALKHVLTGRTSIVIAHRLSTILAADLILVIDRGRIVEHGNHQELLAQAGLYAHLYETQFSREKTS